AQCFLQRLSRRRFPMARKVLATLTAAVIVVSAGAAAPAAAAGAGHRLGYEPVVNSANFVTKITNSYFPLPAGRTVVYRGVKDGEIQGDRGPVTARVRV